MGTMTDTRRSQVRAALGTPNHANETSGDFSDLVSVLNRRYVSVSDSVRIVTGADDLVHPNAGASPGGVGRSTPVIPDMSGHAVKTDEDDMLSPRDLRTEGQVRYMENLITWIAEHDADAAALARTYTDSMTERGRWEAGRGSNVSIWIDRLKAKLALVKSAPKPVPVTQDYVGQPSFAGNVQHDEMPVKVNKNRRPMPMYYAVEIDGVTKFYRVKAGTKPGWWWIEAQASEEFHPVRNVTTKNNILRAIIDQGAEECMRNYGRKINHCGRCHVVLTDATSRANGIGPDCEKMM